MYEKELTSIGFSGNEAKIYEAVLEAGEINVADIAKRTQIHRRSVYDTLQRLIDKGFIFPIFGERENMYAAATPDYLMSNIKEQEKTLKRILPGLEHLKQKSPIQESGLIYRGMEGYRQYIADRARVGEDTYFLGAKGNWVTDEKSMELEKQFQRQLKAKGKKLKILFDPRVKERTDILKTTPADYRFLPKNFETPGVVDVFGDYVVTFNNRDNVGKFGEKGLIFVMISPELAETYRTWFEMIWSTCAQ